MYLIVCRGVPVRNPRRVCDAFLEAVGAECAKSDGRRAVHASNGPEWWRHDQLVTGDIDLE